MKQQKDPETLARECLARSLRWAGRLSRIRTPAPKTSFPLFAYVQFLFPAAPVQSSRFGISHLALLTSALALLAGGCTGPRPLRGGHALTTAGGTQQSLSQGESPSAPSRQTQETIKTRTYTLPAGSLIEQPSTFNLQPSTPLAVTEREETRAQTELGAAQKDTARELGAKLASLKGIVWVGVALFVFGLASLFWPPLQAIIGSVTTSAAITLGGVALTVLPTLVVGNELLILGGVVLAVGAWFLAHRHGHLRGLLTATTVGTRSTASPK